MCFLLFTISLFTQNSISKAQISEDKLGVIYEMSLNTICGMNIDKLQVSIGNIYNVIDMDGNLEGYSLGYFVGDIPYGYAIYSIKNNCIQEFSFVEGLENIYLELCENAEDAPEVESEELVDGVICEDIVNYSVMDSDGTMISTDGLVKECDADSVEDIINSPYCFDDDNLVPKDAFNMYEFWDGIDYDEILKKNDQYFNIVKDCGRAMIVDDYVEKHCVGYCCGVSSATGCLNWMGILKNGSITDTYNEMWDKCETQIVSSEIKDGRTFYYGGAFANVGLNKFFASKGLATRVEHKQRPSFDDYISSINCGDDKEGTPAIINIGSNIDAGQYHSLIALSYYITKYSSDTNYDEYLGVFKNWDYERGDTTSSDPSNITGIHSDTSYKSVRYINYRTIKNDSRMHYDGEFFQNVSSRNIKDVKSYDCDSYGFNIQCSVPYGTRYVYFPTWTFNNGQDDIVWHAGTIKNGTVASAYIRTKDHSYESGTYITHIYAYDSNMKLLTSYQESIINEIDRIITNIIFKDVTSDAFTVSCIPPAGTAYVKMPTWTINNGQDDLIWYDASMFSTRAIRRIYYADHNNEKGKYMTHIYAYDANGNLIDCKASNGFVVK